MKLRERLYRFMYGRYGADQLSRFMLVLYFVVALAGIIVQNILVDTILWLLNMILLVLMFFRMFSKNIYKRQYENGKYLEIKNKVTEYFRYIGNKWKFRKTHVYQKCPFCKSRLKLPKRKGMHGVKCPKCSNSFSVKI